MHHASIFSAFKSAVVLALLLLITPAMARQPEDGGWSFDPSILAAGGDLLQRAPDREIDQLFQAVHAAAQTPAESDALCGLFDPQADRSLSGLNAAASRLGPDSQVRFANAVANVLAGAMQSPPQRHDAAAARQSLKAAGVTAAILHDGFLAGLNADGVAADARSARCQSLRWLLDAMQARPIGERASMTRLLLDEGLARIGTSAAPP